jgi:hypothetical protein
MTVHRPCPIVGDEKANILWKVTNREKPPPKRRLRWSWLLSYD